MQIGFIGLGTMGSHMAMNLIKAGYSLHLFDIRKDAAASHLKAGANWAESSRQAAERSEVIFTSLPGPPEVEAVVSGPDGILSGIRSGSAYFDMSTNSPMVVRTLSDAIAGKGAHMLDCPVSGGPHGAQSGKLAIWVGGDKAVFEKYRSVLGAVGDKAAYAGPIGAATIAKLVHNCIAGIVDTGIAEVFSMGVKAGVDPLVLWSAVRQGAIGRQSIMDRLARHFLLGKYEPPSFALKLAHKDMSLALQVGREYGVPMRMANMVNAEMTEAIARGWGDYESRVFMKLQQDRVGIKIAIDQKLVQDVLDSDKK